MFVIPRFFIAGPKIAYLKAMAAIFYGIFKLLWYFCCFNFFFVRTKYATTVCFVPRVRPSKYKIPTFEKSREFCVRLRDRKMLFTNEAAPFRSLGHKAPLCVSRTKEQKNTSLSVAHCVPRPTSRRT